MFSVWQQHLSDLAQSYGYWLVAVVIALESIGLPVPGETTLVGFSIYAGNTHRLSILLLLLAGMAGAVVGDNIGYWIGRYAGLPLLVRYGKRIGIGEARLRLGRYLFMQHGGKVVFFGRFVAVLRVMAALVAGALRMDWSRFLAFNVTAAIVWVGGYGLAGYFVGDQIKHLLGPVGVASLVFAVLVSAWGYFRLRERGPSLQAAADTHFAHVSDRLADRPR